MLWLSLGQCKSFIDTLDWWNGALRKGIIYNGAQFALDKRWHHSVILYNPLVELCPQSGLAGLRDLDLAGNAVEDRGALSGLDGLWRLDLYGNAVGALRSLRALPSPVWVHVGGSRIEDLAPLDDLTGLTVAGRYDVGPPRIDGEPAGRPNRR